MITIRYLSSGHIGDPKKYKYSYERAFSRCLLTLADGKLNKMFAMIVHQVNPCVLLFYYVNGNACGAIPWRSLQDPYVYLVKGLPVPVVHRKSLPIVRETRLGMKPILFKFEPQEWFHNKPVHPCSRSRIPYPGNIRTTCEWTKQFEMFC